MTAPSPAFRLQREEALGKGIARMAHGRIGHALDELGGVTGSSPETAVHEARKDVKRCARCCGSCAVRNHEPRPPARERGAAGRRAVTLAECATPT